MKQSRFYAHTLENHPPTEWEPIPVHLQAVAKQASDFAAKFNATSWGEILGLWHDLGKYASGFQKKLYTANGIEAHLEGQANNINHSAAGAKYANDKLDRFGRLIAYIIAGHHTGLADMERLNERLKEESGDWLSNVDQALLTIPEPKLPQLTIERGNGKRFAFQLAFFTRMLFSCLIDADRLETESFCNPELAAERTPPPSISQLSDALNNYLSKLTTDASPTAVNQHRSKVLQDCRHKATLPPGLFSLTVPTGGGKTLASLAFALDHAKTHGLRRVVMAIPFTSIIEQTAEVYRKVFSELGGNAIVEHHSNIDPEKETRSNRLAVENWDASLIVTTNVQVFETLFANRTTPCRKLHRLAGSVIILDEAQTLPVKLLRPCLAALRELVADYGCSVVLCTATQPALEKRDEFKIGLEGIREITTNASQLYTDMRRVEVKQFSQGTTDDDTLLQHLGEQPSWLTIVNTRGHAMSLYRRLATEDDQRDLFHLSTYMCGQHRSEKVKEIRQRLVDKKPCRVISTQLIEAGVDVDFPVVYRALAGVDSIAQAAGRCNREGKLDGLGKVWLFDPTDWQVKKGDLMATIHSTRQLLADYPDLLDPQAIRRYFELHYWNKQGVHDWDDNRVMDCFPEEKGDFAYNFKTASERFQFIEETSETIFVPHEEGEQLIETLRDEGPNRDLLRKLQRYTVGLPKWLCQPHVAAHDIELLDSGYQVLINKSIYHPELGVLVDKPGFYDAEKLYVG